MNILSLLKLLIAFLVNRLTAHANNLDTKANKDTASINYLIARRMKTLETAAEAAAIAGNIRKLVKGT